MKRMFADLNLHLNQKDLGEPTRIIAKVKALGYDLVGVPFSNETSIADAQKFRASCSLFSLDLASRVNIRPRTSNELTHILRRVRREFELVCVICESKEVARQAAKDRRVDLLSFPSLDFRKRFFDRAEAELASNCLSAFEIDMKPIIVLDGASRIRFLANLRRETSIATEFHVPVILSSGASEPTLLRRPRELAALAALFGMNEDSALDAVSRNPINIVERNRDKLSFKFVAPGIRLVKEDKTNETR
jgi:RNase P/RNase MRP subunit p30